MHKLYIGNETYNSLSHAHDMVKQLRNSEKMELLVIDGDKTDSSKIVDLLSSSSLFTQSRVLFIKRLYRNSDRGKIIEFLLDHLEKEGTDHIIIWEDQKVSAATKYVKYFKVKKTLEEFNKINKRSFLTYVKDICESNNIKIDRNLLTVLAQRSNYDLQRLQNNINKIKLIEDKTVTAESIENIVANTLEEDIWKLLDEMNSSEGNPISTLEQIFAQEIDPHYILPMIARNIRLITLTKYLISKQNTYSQIASKLKIPPFTVKPLINATNKYDWKSIKSKYEKLSSLDYKIKTGQIEPKLGLTLFCTIV